MGVFKTFKNTKMSIIVERINHEPRETLENAHNSNCRSNSIRVFLTLDMTEMQRDIGNFFGLLFFRFFASAVASLGSMTILCCLAALLLDHVKDINP